MTIGRSFAWFFSKIWRAVDGLRKILHLLLMLMLFSLVIGALSSTTPKLPARAALYIQPAGALVDQLAGDPLERALGEAFGDAEAQTLVQDIVDALKYARDDKRISSVVLDLNAIPGGGLSKFRRIADAIEDFRGSGKPVVARADFYTQGSYYLASHADEVYLHPDGELAIYGFGVYMNYFKDAIDKLQIDWNVFRAGTYKSAVEPFTRNDMSEEDRESLSHVVNQLWTLYTDDIEASRNLAPGTVKSLAADLPARLVAADGDIAQLALELGLVDGLMTREQFQQRMVEIAGSNGEESAYPVASMEDYLRHARLLRGGSAEEQNVAIVVAAGEILYGSQPPGMIGGDSTAKLLRQARMDDSVKAVVLRVDSPGGSSLASEIIRNEVEALREAGKPVVASMSSMAASGGYWISVAADRIYASPYTITGSIGIFGMLPTFQRSLGAVGISTDGFGTSPLAGQFRVDRALSDEAKMLVQASIDSSYRNFITRVADHRNMTPEDVDLVAQGRIWSGQDALDNGLVDGLGEIDMAIQAAAELAGLEEGAYGTLDMEVELSPGEQLLLDMMGGAHAMGIVPDLRAESSVERLARVLGNSLSLVERFNDPRGVYAHCFCRFE